MPRKKGWTCQRVTNGVKCGHVNLPRLRKCVVCGKLKAQRRRPAHMAALELDYEYYVTLNGGDFCGICGRKPSAKRRLDRDHEHKGEGTPRGLLCARCNQALPDWMTSNWLRAAAAYIDSVKTRRLGHIGKREGAPDRSTTLASRATRDIPALSGVPQSSDVPHPDK